MRHLLAKGRLCLMLAALGSISFLPVAHASHAVTLDHLRCEYLTDPIGIDVLQPRLSWQLVSNERGETQNGYQILVASDPEILDQDKGDLWDSGRVDSNHSIQVAYAGKPLHARSQCFWKVRVWDMNGKPSAYSRPAYWEIGLLQPMDWAGGQWIARTTDTNSNPAPLFRKQFNVASEVKLARAYICGLGYYELYLNGQRIGDHLLDPGFTRYDKRVLYNTYDVTAALKSGQNAIGVMLGNGWYNVHTRAVWDFDKAPWRAAPKLLMQLYIEFKDGSKFYTVTDDKWKTSTGAVLFDSIYGGEIYDARLEKTNWTTVNFNDSSWSPALAVEAPKGKLAAQMMPPIKLDKKIEPVKIVQVKPDVYVYDFGQNFAGFAELTIEGKAGKAVTMKYGERLAADGTVDQTIISEHIMKVDNGQQFQTDSYTLEGNGPEKWHARFSYYGFQYVEVHSEIPLTLKNLTGCFIHSAVPEVGTFECSNEMFNKVWRNGRWSYLSNLQGIPTDCPHREKNGWTGDAHLACEQGLLNYDSTAVYAKWINDLGDEQRESGELPGIVPTAGWGYKWGNGPAWDSSFLLIPFYLWEYSGDTRVLTSHYEGLKRYVDYLTSKSKNGIVDLGLNDWAQAKTTTSREITSTGYYYQDALIVAKAASLLGKDREAHKYEDLAGAIKDAFNKNFYNPATGLYGYSTNKFVTHDVSQTSMSCALYQGLVEKTNTTLVMSNLVNMIKRNDYHIDTGILGAKYILNTLSDNNRFSYAYAMANQHTQPSWGWWIDQGATTLWEQWNGNDSRNHIMYGDICAWFYKTIAGIGPDPTSPGFKHFIIKPHVASGMTWAKATHQCMYGLIASEWKHEGFNFSLKVTVPPNTTATIYVPSSNLKWVMENGKPATKAVGVRNATVEDGYSAIEVDSGTYQFTCNLPQI